MTYDIMMPIDNRSFTKGKIKLFIKWLLDNGYIHGDNDIRVEKTYMHEYDDEPAWERREIEVESYDDVLRVLESHDTTVLNLIFGHSKYSDEYREGYTSGTNELTDTIQSLAFEHCSRNKIEPCIEIYGGFSIGLVSKYSEDLLGEKSGISFDGDGNMIYYFQKTGFLNTMLENNKLSNILDKASEIFEADKTLIVRY